MSDNWKHRSEGMVCGTCMYFSKKPGKAGNEVFGRCRRHAPTLSGFPAVWYSDWCGDHKLDENRLFPASEGSGGCALSFRFSN